MKLDLGILNTSDIETSSTRKKIKVRLSANAEMMIFQSYIKNLYSNIIGTIIRELTSNCYDAHIAANVDDPIIIRLNQELNGKSISFIDVGTGMSPDTIENIYGVLFESTKRETDLQHGGFGVGSKTPLAYNNGSFFIITRFNGIEYGYNVYPGATSPEIDCLYEKPTTARNGTEIKINVVEKDLQQFYNEFYKQLYYFDTVIFEGFDNSLKTENNFTIIRTNNFLYRGNGLGDSIHICLGRAAYPINFSALGINQHDWKFPIAIKANINDVNITLSRESLEYSDKTKTYIINKLEEIRKEIIALYEKQSANIVTIADLLRVKSKIQILYFNDKSFIYLNSFSKELPKIKFSQFKYNYIREWISFYVLSEFYTVKTYGNKKVPTGYGYGNNFEGNYIDLPRLKNVFHFKRETKRNIIKQSYYSYSNDGRFYILTKKYLTDAMKESGFNMLIANSDILKNLDYQKVYDELCLLYDEIITYVESNSKDYEEGEVPKDFIILRSSKSIIKEYAKNIINISDYRFEHKQNKVKIKYEKLASFKGKIFYGFQEHSNQLQFSRSIFSALFSDKHLARAKDDTFKNKSIMFVRTTPTYAKYIKALPNAIPIKEFNRLILKRKRDRLVPSLLFTLINEKHERIHNYFKSNQFKHVDENIYNKASLVKAELNKLEIGQFDFGGINKEEFMKIMEIDLSNMFSAQKELDELLELTAKFSPEFRCLSISEHNFAYEHLSSKIYIKVLKKILNN